MKKEQRDKLLEKANLDKDKKYTDKQLEALAKFLKVK
ncbi:hypothetical protein LCGC14_0625780 [marine sediment metagenome]|uniref:Uncharacterized protein n=1 Tax=marine sediment metagenome TaxID=412755 RepID=A0A0F9R8F7_9ZZZZ